MDVLKKKVGTKSENKHMKDLKKIFNNGINIEKNLDFAKNFHDTARQCKSPAFPSCSIGSSEFV